MEISSATNHRLTVVSDHHAGYELLKGMDIMRWALFMLISVGRGTDLREITAGESEKLNQWLLGLSKTAPFQVKTTEATHYRRLAIRELEAAGLAMRCATTMPSRPVCSPARW